METLKICGWFVDNKLSIRFGDNKTKSILFASKRRAKNIGKLNVKIKRNKYKTTSTSKISWMCIRRVNAGEPMTLKVINKITLKLKFFYRKNNFLTPELRGMLEGFFLSGFSFTNIHDSQDRRGRGRLPL